METITIFDLNAMYESVNHKLGGVTLNGRPMSWRQWMLQCSAFDVDQTVSYILEPFTKAIHIRLAVAT